MIMNAKKIGTPPPKVETIDIPGGDGVLDLTEAFGDVKYQNRKLSFDFSTIAPKSQFMDVFSRVQNLLHGRRMDIRLSDDPGWYYTGRVSVNEWKADKAVGTFTVDCDCEPYKYKATETKFSAVLDGVTTNLYDTSKVLLVSTAISKQEDGFCTIDAVNNGTAWQYITFFHNPHAAGAIAPNQNVTLMLESKDFEVFGDVETRFFFTSHQEAQPDYFSPASFATTLVTHKHKITALYPATIKSAETIAAAKYFIRSFIALAPGCACKGKFRVSILPGDVKASAFTYVSYDGTMKGLQIVNSKMRAVPRITASAPMTLYYEGASYQIPAGVSSIPEIELREGINDIAVKGSGTISFAWREGSL